MATIADAAIFGAIFDWVIEVKSSPTACLPDVSEDLSPIDWLSDNWQADLSVGDRVMSVILADLSANSRMDEWFLICS